jgi:hypothetical protein
MHDPEATPDVDADDHPRRKAYVAPAVVGLGGVHGRTQAS